MTKIRGAVLEKVGATEPWASSRPVHVDLVDLDDPGPGEIEVRMEAAGVCHSDLSRVNGDREVVVPVVLGHEGSGVVVRCGPDTAGVEPGDRVVMTFMPRCGTCDACLSTGWALCRRGADANAKGEMLRGGRRLRRHGREVDHHGGVSAFATRAVVDVASVVVVPHEVPADVAALLGCAVLTGGGAVLNAGGLVPGMSVAVVGLGGVGFSALMVAATQQPSHALAVDMLPSKLLRATDFGATDAKAPDEALASGQRFDLVIDCTGNADALQTAMRLTRPGGRTVTVGLPHPSTRLSVSPLSLVTEARSLIGSYLGSGIPRVDIERYASMYLAGELPVEKLISGHIPLVDINLAMDRLQAGGVLRQIVDLAHEDEPS